MGDLELLRKRAAGLSLCAKWNTRPVMGDGPADAKVVLVGEAPGRFEEKEGRPFVGLAGKFLTRELEKIGLQRKDVYITNVVKCRPPDNRKPTPEEVKEALPILMEELIIIKPNVVVLLGDTAVKAMLDKNYKVSKHHGKLIDKGGHSFLITAHPSAAMRFKKMRAIFEADMRELARLIRVS
jgi:DNA polymerase